MPGEKPSIKEILARAGEAETKKDNNSAVGLYNEAIKTDPLNRYPYDRLMKIFRQLKQYKKELLVINKGISVFEKFYQKSKTKSKKITDLSQKLNKSFGLIDKKGNNLYDPEPIAGWKKRKLIVEKKLA